MYIGRINELGLLKGLLKKKESSLVIIKGRRRIGKSTLIKEFCKQNSVAIYEFQGLAPADTIGYKEQLKNYAQILSKFLKIKKIEFDNWYDALLQINNLEMKSKTVVLLDEVSWMGMNDRTFASTIKLVWDSCLKENKNLIFVLCGSNSAWIENNIAKNSGFAGRVDLDLNIKELSLHDSYEVINQNCKRNKFSSKEYAKLVSLIGGVPKYLETLSANDTAENLIKKHFLNPTGFFFNEFIKIFSEIYGKRAAIYQQIMHILANEKCTISQLAKALKLPLNGDLTEYVSALEVGGYIRKDLSWKLLDGMSTPSANKVMSSKSKIYRLTISDNYSRFFLKYMLPRLDRLKKLPTKESDGIDFINWPTLIGIQFETLMQNNLEVILKHLNIPSSDVVNLGPYYQVANKRQHSIQIDLLIQTKHNTLFLVEFKTSSKVTDSVIEEVVQKIKYFKHPKSFSIRPCLIFTGELSESLEAQGFDFFYKMISFEELCETKFK